MFLSLPLLKKLVSVDGLTSKEIAEKLSLSGSHTEQIISTSNKASKIVSAKIENIIPHETLTKLSICDINFGNKKDIIVTAAKNMKVGDIVPVAIPGSTLSDGTEINLHDFKGVVSNGMFCSFAELGFSKEIINKEDDKGILILDPKTPLGVDLVEYLELDNNIIEFEITPNRVDCLSQFGMAIESAATFNRELRFNLEELFDIDNLNGINDIDVEVDSDNVNAYSILKVGNVIVKDSNLWVKLRLMESGIRPVNNIVDALNLAMIISGIPMHAFDLNKISGNKLYITEAKEKEELVLLDGSKNKIENGDIIIKDSEKTVCIAGIMGLENSAVDINTKDIIIEIASFNNEKIQNSGNKLDINSESKNRFSKKIDSNMILFAANVVAKIFQDMGFEDIEYKLCKKPAHAEKNIDLRYKRVRELLGVEISEDKIIEILSNLSLKPKKTSNEMVTVDIPSYRSDLNLEVDLIEEVGRVYGFHNIPSQVLKTDLEVGSTDEIKKVSNILRYLMEGMGYTETLTYSFVGESLLNESNFADTKDYLKVKNPLGEEYSIMRPSLVPYLLDVCRKNFNRGSKKLSLFEIGNIFDSNDFNQRKEMILLNANCGDFFSLKSVLENIFRKLNLPERKYERSDNDLYHPGISAKVLVNGIKTAEIGKIHPLVEENFGINEVFVATIDIDKICDLIVKDNFYKEISKFQEVYRELSFELDKKVLFGDIRNEILEQEIEYLADVKFFDEYFGEKISADKKALTIQLVISSSDKTLNESEINNVFNKVIDIVTTKFSGILRGV